MKPLKIETVQEISDKFNALKDSQINHVNFLITMAARGGQYEAIVPGKLLEEVEAIFLEAGYEITRYLNMNDEIDYYLIKWKKGT